MGLPLKLPHLYIGGLFPRLNTMLALHNLAQDALSTLEQLTFNIKNVEKKATKTGNVGFRVVTDQGKTVTFWMSNMEDVIEEIDAENFRVIAGTQIADDGALIDKKSKSNGFWK